MKGALFLDFLLFFDGLEGEADSNTTRETRQQNSETCKCRGVTVRSFWAFDVKINIGNVAHGVKQTRKSQSRVYFVIEKRRAGFQK